MTSIQTIKLAKGAHDPGSGEGCVMEVVSLLAGECWSDCPKTVAPALSTFARLLNDTMENDDERDSLWPLTPRFIGTAERSFNYLIALEQMGFNATGHKGALTYDDAEIPPGVKVTCDVEGCDYCNAAQRAEEFFVGTVARRRSVALLDILLPAGLVAPGELDVQSRRALTTHQLACA